MTTSFRLLPAVRVFIVAVAWFGCAVLVLDVNSLDTGSRSATVVWIACVGAAVTVAVDLGSRGTSGSTEPLIEYERALRTGEVPARIEPDVWRSGTTASGRRWCLSQAAPLSVDPL